MRSLPAPCMFRVQPPAGGGREGPAEHRAAPSCPLPCGGWSYWVWSEAPTPCLACSGSGRPSCPLALSFPTCRVGALDCMALRPEQHCPILAACSWRRVGVWPAVLPQGEEGLVPTVGGQGLGQGDEPLWLSRGAGAVEHAGLALQLLNQDLFSPTS